MKKFLLLFVTVFFSISCHAISLFPHFVDVAGNYEDGTNTKFTELNIPTIYWRADPFLLSTLAAAEEFLQDTLPFSNYNIGKDTKTLSDGTVIVTYSASLETGVLENDEDNKGKFSNIYLIQSPNEPLYVGFYEDQL